MRIFIGFFLIFLTCIQLSAQEQQKQIRITGHIVAIEDTSGISYVNVLNLTHPSGTICDKTGKFQIVCHYGDTLQFSSLGYENANFFTGSLDPANKEHFVGIKLKTGIYVLPSVTVLPFSSSEGLSRAFLDTKLSDADKKEMALIKKMKINRDEIGVMPTSGISFFGIASAIYNLFSKDAKIRKKYKKMLHGESINTFIDRRFNYKVVSKIIGQDNQNLINDFMQQCHFSIDFLVNSNDYDLYFSIKQNWLRYASERNIK